MRSLSRLAGAAAFAASALLAQPVIKGGAVNAASYAAPNSAGGGIAQGSMFVIKGSGLGPAQLQLLSGFPLPVDISGTKVNVTIAGATKQAYIVYTSAAQLAAILPSNTPVGAGTVTVTYNGQASAPAPIRVVKSSFGTFTLNQGGSGPGVLQNVNADSSQPVNTLTVPARPGQAMILWGTGLGPASDEENAKPVPGDLPVNVEVYVGGKPAVVTYKGRSGCCAGLDQIVFTIPQGVEGCYVPVVVKTGDTVSNFSTISVAASGATCTDTNGISGPELAKAQANGNYRVGSINLVRSATKMTVPDVGTIENTSELGQAGFYKYDIDSLIRAQGIGGSAVSQGGCVVFVSDIGSSGTPSGPVDPIKPGALDAGPAINVTGPKGMKQLAKRSPGNYSGEFASGMGGIPGLPQGIPGLPGGAGNSSFLEPGSYTIDNGSGGADVQAFNVRMDMKSLLKWENQDSINKINRGQGLPITWSGGDPDGYVTMMGISADAKVAGIFLCTEKARAGQFTVPSYVLANMPANSGDESIGMVTVSGVSISSKFSAPGLDVGFVSATSSTQKTVQFQ